MRQTGGDTPPSPATVPLAPESTVPAPITHTAIDDIAPYAGPHAIPGIRFRAARAALGVSSWGMNVLDLDPHCSGHPAHDHTADGQEEVYVVLSGSVRLVAGDESRVLAAGDMARVGPGVHRQLLTEAEGARILALGATPGAVFTPQL